MIRCRICGYMTQRGRCRVCGATNSELNPQFDRYTIQCFTLKSSIIFFRLAERLLFSQRAFRVSFDKIHFATALLRKYFLTL